MDKERRKRKEKGDKRRTMRREKNLAYGRH